MNMKSLLSSLALSLLFDSHASAAELVLADRGAAPAPVIVPKDATPFTKLAAQELADYLGRIGGAKVAVIEGAPVPTPEHAIWVGLQPEVKRLFPGTDFEFQHPEETLIHCDGRHLAIVGRDVWDAKMANIPGGKTEAQRKSHLAGFPFANRDVEGYQAEYGTVNAVYTFLQDRLGVRWLWPGADGEVVPQQARVAFEPFTQRHHPTVRMRHGVFAPMALYKAGGAPNSTGGAWARRQRVQLDSLFVAVGGHGFGDWKTRFLKTHPEYFALQAGGERNQEGPATAAKICESNPAVWEQWLADMDEAIAKNPHRTSFSCAPNDSARHGHCCCANCRAWDSPDAERRLWMYGNGENLQCVALSDRQVRLANTLARMLNERHPGRGLTASIHAYGYSCPAPVRETPSDQVYIALVHGFLFDLERADAHSPSGVKVVDEFKAWLGKTKNVIWRPNLGDYARWQSGGPGDITYAGENFRSAANQGVKGIHIDQVGSWWATQGPQYYLMAQLAWNPARSVEEIMADYYRSGFGSAAEPIKGYWTLMETARRKVGTELKTWPAVFTAELFQTAAALLAQADASVGLSDEHRARIAFVRAGLDYLRLNTANQALARQIIAASAPSPDLKAQMAANWKQIEQIAARHPEALPRSQLASNKGELDYIHPDSDHKALEAIRQRKEQLDTRLRALMWEK